jgi:hypothetical protein
MYRYRRVLVGFIATGCLVIILAAGAGVWGIHHGLVRAPTGVARLGNLEVLAFTGVDFSTARSPRGYYAIWVGLRKDSDVLRQPWHPLAWAHQLVQLEVPASKAR